MVAWVGVEGHRWAMSVLARIDALLGARAVAHTRRVHPPTFTSAQAAAARGADLRIGGKSLVMKLGERGDFAVFAVSAARRTDGRAIRRHLGLRRLRFATPEELMALTGLTPGCVPPFGDPVLPGLTLFVDESIAANDRIAFSPGDHGVSIELAVADYLALAQPAAIFGFSRPP